MTHLPQEVRSAIRYFAFTLANGTVDPGLMEVDYRPSLVEFGSELEMAFTIFLNVLEVSADGAVSNADHAQARAAEWIKSYVISDYHPEPPLADWETELS